MKAVYSLKKMLLKQGDKDYNKTVESYIEKGEIEQLTSKNTNRLNDSLMEKNNNMASILAEILFKNFSKMPIESRITAINELSCYFSQKKRDEEVAKRVQLLKDALQLYNKNSIKKNWQEILLNIHFIEKAYNALQLIDSYNFLEEDENKNSSFLTKGDENYSALIGTTFCSSDRFFGKKEQTIILDAFAWGKIESCLKDNQIFLGCIADGAGGHWDTQQDKAIGRLAKYACTYMMRYMAAHASKPDFFQFGEKIWIKMLQLTAEVIKYKIFPFDERTSILTYIAFPNLNKGGYDIYSCNIGDCMLSTYNYSTKELKTLVPAERSKGWGPSLFPDDINKHARFYSSFLPEDSMLLAMTDGVYESFALNQELKKEGELEIALFTLNPGVMEQLIIDKNHEQAAIIIKKEILAALRKAVEKKLNNNSEKKWSQGDDLTLVITTLPPLKSKTKECWFEYEKKSELK